MSYYGSNFYDKSYSRFNYNYVVDVADATSSGLSTAVTAFFLI